jgi:putative peptide zinc metalloprotease protein
MTATSAVADPPQLVEGTQFLGEYQGSGNAQSPMLVRRRDGQVLQLSPLLYMVANCVDGQHPVERIAELVTARAGRRLTAEGVEYLLDEKLGPLGLLASRGAGQEPPRARPLLDLRARRRLIPDRMVNSVASRLRFLFSPPAVVAVLIGLGVVDYAILFREGIGHSVLALARTPAYLFVVLALIILSILIHEFGHATGCRYSGGRPGGIGVGIYLVWPAFYTNVTDAYRLPRSGRLRTDLGGAYFTAISVVGFGAAYALSSFLPLVIAIAAVQLQMLQQLLPVVRFDGYYVLGDLVGVPDLFSRVRPILRNLFRRQPNDPRVKELRPRIRVIVTVWVLTVVPLLVAAFAWMLVHLPRYLSESWQSLTIQWTTIGEAVRSGDGVGLGYGVLQALAVFIPVVGIALVLSRLARMVIAYASRLRSTPRYAAASRPAAAGLRRAKDVEPQDSESFGGPGRPRGRPRLAPKRGFPQPKPDSLRDGADAADTESTQPTRREFYPTPVIDGRPADALGPRWRRRMEQLLASRGEQEEAELERHLAERPTVSRANIAAVISPKGGVGKTTSAFVLGDLIADRRKLRVIAVDANPDFGTLPALAPDNMRCERSLADLLTDIDDIHTAADLRRYVPPMRSGVHLLGAPSDAAVMARLGPDAYGEVLTLLSTFYELVLLDLGTGVADPLAQFAIGRADQVVLVTTPEWVTSTAVLGALEHLEHERTTVAANKVYPRGQADLSGLGRRLRERRLHRIVAIPHDDQLATMLDTGTYDLGALTRNTRMAIKRLGLAVAEQLE